MKATAKAVRKAITILDARADVRMCLKAKVCPKCANDLEESRASIGEEKLECVHCEFEIPKRNKWVEDK